MQKVHATVNDNPAHAIHRAMACCVLRVATEATVLVCEHRPLHTETPSKENKPRDYKQTPRGNKENAIKDVVPITPKKDVRVTPRTNNDFTVTPKKLQNESKKVFR